MEKVKTLLKKQVFIYIICIIVGFIIYPVSTISWQRIKNYMENKKEIPYPEKPVPFVLDYLNSWGKENYDKMCNMMSDQLKKDQCIYSVRTKSIKIMDVSLIKEDKESAVVYVQFKGQDWDGSHLYFWTYDLSRNKKDNSWEITSYGSSGGV